MDKTREGAELPDFEPGEVKAPAKKSRSRLLAIAGGGLALACICLVGIVALGGSDDNTAEPAAQALAEVEATDEPVEEAAELAGAPTEEPGPTGTPEPTETPEPTATPRPTATQEPTATPDPNFLAAGTYLVAEEIQPGLYVGNAGEGFFGSCYWARLADLTGSLDSLLANDNANGQYYVQVLESDEALETDCDLRFLPELPAASATFPAVIAPGAYLVGIDVQPGRYRGEGGDDFMESCYWARLSSFTGDLGSILANNNATGQFFIDVQPGDFGLETDCELELVE